MMVNVAVKTNKKFNGKSSIKNFSPRLNLKYNVHINTIKIYKTTIYNYIKSDCKMSNFNHVQPITALNVAVGHMIY